MLWSYSLVFHEKPGMTRDVLFTIHANIVKPLVEAVAENCPSTLIHIISNLVNSTVKLLDVDDPVIGGYSGITILPLLSKTKPATTFTDKEVEKLTLRIQNAGTKVVYVKAGAGFVTLSMAYTAARFVEVKLGKGGVESLITSDLLKDYPNTNKRLWKLLSQSLRPISRRVWLL